jgi:uncharacterized integral membrane protein
MKGLRRIVFVGVFVGLLLVGWRFAAGNSTTVQVDYVFSRSGDVALWKALLLSAGVGVSITFFLMILSLIGARLETRRFRKTVSGLETELEQFRPAPAIVGNDSGGENAVRESSGREVVLRA